jgi:hypothetical protein
VHDIAYRPRVVLVVENRDSRLWFPPVSETIVVEGGGRAAAALLANVPWIRSAEHVVTTAGPTPFRRIEQEAIPLIHAATRLLQTVEGRY